MTASLLSLWPQSLSLTNPRVTGFSDKSVSGDCEHESPCLACEHQVGRIVHLPYHAGARACLWNLQACLIVATVILSQKQGLPMGGPGHPIKGQVGLLQSLRKSRPLFGSLPTPTKVQNRDTLRPAPGLGCFWVVREGATASPPSPLFTTIYLDSLDQTPNAPTWPDFIKLSPPPREAGPNDAEKNPIF